MTHQQEGTALPGACKQIVKVRRDMANISWEGTRIAESITGAVIGTGARFLRDLALDRSPIQGAAGVQPGLQHYGR